MQYVLSESYNDGKGDPALCIAADEIFSTVFSSWHGYSKARTCRADARTVPIYMHIYRGSTRVHALCYKHV